MSEYSRLGFPGAIGSVDCTHIAWDMAPAMRQSLHQGKEGYPSLAYEMTVDHCRRFMSVPHGHPGARSDKTIALFDEFVMSVKDKRLFHDCEFQLRKLDGTMHTERGAYLISDNGYHKWRILQCPIKAAYTPAELAWSKRIESTRKDVECAFGILKGRWRILKLPVNLHSKQVIDAVVWTCVILHNMLLTNDGMRLAWERDVAWDGVDGLHGEDDTEDLPAASSLRAAGRVLAPDTDFSRVGLPGVDDVEVDQQHFVLRDRLVEHFAVAQRDALLEWPHFERGHAV